MNNRADVKCFVKEQLSGIRMDDTKGFQVAVIGSIYEHLEKLGHDPHDIKTMIDEIIMEKLDALVKKLKDLNDK